MKKLLVLVLLLVSVSFAQVGTFPPTGGTASGGSGCSGTTLPDGGSTCLEQSTNDPSGTMTTRAVIAYKGGNLVGYKASTTPVTICTSAAETGCGGAVTAYWLEWGGGIPWVFNLATGGATGVANTIRCAALVPRTTLSLGKGLARVTVSAPAGTASRMAVYDAAGTTRVDQTAVVLAAGGQPQSFTFSGGTTLTGGLLYWVAIASESATTQWNQAVDADNSLGFINGGAGVFFSNCGSASGTGAAFTLPTTVTPGSFTKATTAVTTISLAVSPN